MPPPPMTPPSAQRSASPSPASACIPPPFLPIFHPDSRTSWRRCCAPPCGKTKSSAPISVGYGKISAPPSAWPRWISACAPALPFEECLMSLPPPDLTPFLQRRQRVLAWMQAQGGGVAILPTAPEVMRNRDADYPYRHDSDFFYLTGFIEPEAWLVLVADDTQQRSLLFCREKNLDQEIWTGYRIGPEAARAAFLVDEAFAVYTLDEHLPDLLLNQTNLFAPLADGSALDARVAGWLNAAGPQGRSGATAPQRIWDLRAQLAAMRLIKDQADIQSMRKAAQMSAQAHRRAMQTTRP